MITVTVFRLTISRSTPRRWRNGPPVRLPSSAEPASTPGLISSPDELRSPLRLRVEPAGLLEVCLERCGEKSLNVSTTERRFRIELFIQLPANRPAA